MNIILANKFMDFLTDTIAETKIPIWVALVAATVLIVIVAVIILLCMGKKNKKANVAATTAEPIAETAKLADDTVDEIAFDEVQESFEIEELEDMSVVEEKTITAPIVEEKVVAAAPVAEEKVVAAPIVVEKEPVPTPIAEEKEVDTQPMATVVENKTSTAAPIAKPIIKTQEPVEEKVALPERGIDTTENRIIAKPLTKAAEDETVKPIAKPIAKPVAKPVVKAEPVKKQAEVKPEPAKPVAKPIAKPVAKAEPAAAAKPIAKPVAKPVVKAEPVKEPEIKVLDEEKETFGKYLIRDTSSNPDRPFTFELVANNGQLLFESEPFKQKPRQASIDAFKKHVKEGIFVVDEDKQGTFRYKLYSSKNVLIGVGETYKTKASCESSIESVKRFSESATIVEDKTAQ